MSARVEKKKNSNYTSIPHFKPFQKSPSLFELKHCKYLIYRMISSTSIQHDAEKSENVSECVHAFVHLL